jgi:hypothetical protein
MPGQRDAGPLKYYPGLLEEMQDLGTVLVRERGGRWSKAVQTASGGARRWAGLLAPAIILGVTFHLLQEGRKHALHAQFSRAQHSLFREVEDRKGATDILHYFGAFGAGESELGGSHRRQKHMGYPATSKPFLMGSIPTFHAILARAEFR